MKTNITTNVYDLPTRECGSCNGHGTEVVIITHWEGTQDYDVDPCGACGGNGDMSICEVCGGEVLVYEDPPVCTTCGQTYVRGEGSGKPN